MRRCMQHTVTMRHYIFNYCVRSIANAERSSSNFRSIFSRGVKRARKDVEVTQDIKGIFECD